MARRASSHVGAAVDRDALGHGRELLVLETALALLNGVRGGSASEVGTQDRVLAEVQKHRHRASFDAWIIQQTYKRTLAETRR